MIIPVSRLQDHNSVCLVFLAKGPWEAELNHSAAFAMWHELPDGMGGGRVRESELKAGWQCYGRGGTGTVLVHWSSLDLGLAGVA